MASLGHDVNDLLAEPPLDVYDSLHAVTEIEAGCHDIGRRQ